MRRDDPIALARAVLVLEAAGEDPTRQPLLNEIANAIAEERLRGRYTESLIFESQADPDGCMCRWIRGKCRLCQVKDRRAQQPVTID